ncbi:transmembrane protein 272-like [Patiria miniata]|uniref:Uncharacterized protein n=1 Tax=Patiria miniata TaxID=46514 RepID=A0A913ZVY8_PATMI|nr:transmembrane protein 272-like [Patiria miniata]
MAADEGPIIMTDKTLGDVDPELGLTNSVPPPPDYGTSVNPADPSIEAPPPAYDEIAQDAPPSYQAIFGKMQDAKNTSSTPVHFLVKVISILLNTIVVTVVLGVMLAVPIAMIVVGAIYINDCPVEPKIPIYLVVTGSFYILKSAIDLIVRCKRRQDQDTEGNNEEEPENRKENTFSRLIGCFLFAFFIAGNVWVYRNYPPSDNILDANYCFGPLYYFAFWIITSCYILVALACCCVCCAAGATAAVSE